jgi:hypothetical protein
MQFLAELQKRGWQVVMCPGKVEVVASIPMRQRAIEERVTVWDLLDEAIGEITHSAVVAGVAEAKIREEERVRELGRFRGYNDA